jgi:hypothetical protein
MTTGDGNRYTLLTRIVGTHSGMSLMGLKVIWYDGSHLQISPVYVTNKYFLNVSQCRNPVVRL